VEIRRILVQNQVREIVQETLSQKKKKKKSQKRADGVAQGEDPKFKHQYCKKERRKTTVRYHFTPTSMTINI
jgi:hypothetical protein